MRSIVELFLFSDEVTEVQNGDSLVSCHIRELGDRDSHAGCGTAAPTFSSARPQPHS